MDLDKFSMLGGGTDLKYLQSGMFSTDSLSIKSHLATHPGTVGIIIFLIGVIILYANTGVSSLWGKLIMCSIAIPFIFYAGVVYTTYQSSD
jgi:uncharacterized protein YqhQ